MEQLEKYPIILIKEEETNSILDEKIFLKDGHFEIRLLRKERNLNLPYNQELSFHRLHNLERNLEQNRELDENVRNIKKILSTH